MGPSYIVAIDLGATKLLATVFDNRLKKLDRIKCNVAGSESPKVVFDLLCQAITDLIENLSMTGDNLLGIALGVPSPIDPAKGVIENSPNLALNGFPLRAKLKELFSCPVLVENDANAGTYGEFIMGAAQGYKHVIGIFPGSGIGGGLVLNGALYRGANGGAGELGHMIIQLEGRRCGCGHYGCIEAMASRLAVAKDVMGLAISGQAPYLASKLGHDITAIRSGLIAKAIENGDDKVAEVVNRSADQLGIAMGNLVNIFNPELFVVGGGMVEQFGKPYVERLSASMRAHATQYLVESVKVVPAKLGDDAIAMGAAALLLDELGVPIASKAKTRN